MNQTRHCHLPFANTRFGTRNVVAYGYFGADLGVLAEQFRAKCQGAFGRTSVSRGQDLETAAYLLALKR